MSRRMILIVVLSLVVVGTLFVAPYGKVGSLNTAWAQQYLGTVASNAQCTATNLTGVPCSYETGYGYAAFVGGCNYLVYRMTQYGTLLQVLDVYCSGNTLYFMVSGTGHYFFYAKPAGGAPRNESVQYTKPVDFTP